MLRKAALIFLMFSSHTSHAASEYRLGAPLFANMDVSLILAQADTSDDSVAAVADQESELEVLQEFASQDEAMRYVQSLAPHLRDSVDVIAVQKEMLRTYLGPFDTEEQAQQAAGRIDTSIIQYRLGLVEALGGYVISFGLFQDDENLQNFYRVLASFGFSEINNIPLSQDMYQVVRKPKVVEPAEPGVVEGLSFDSLFFDDIPPPEQEEKAVEEPSGWFSDLDWSGYLKNETAYRYHEPRTISKISVIKWQSF